MEYQNIVAENLKKHYCPFCHTPQEQILDQGDYFYLTLARAPYTADHVLIVPFEHTVLFEDLSDDAIKERHHLTKKRLTILHKHHQDINILLRDGRVGWSIGKSIDHLHWHLIPSLAMSGKNTGDDRKYLDDQEFATLTASFLATYQQ